MKKQESPVLLCERSDCADKPAAFAFWFRWGVALECFGHAMDTIKHAPNIKREAIPRKRTR